MSVLAQLAFVHNLTAMPMFVAPSRRHLMAYSRLHAPWAANLAYVCDLQSAEFDSKDWLTLEFPSVGSCR
jgi:hypothetical protein